MFRDLSGCVDIFRHCIVSGRSRACFWLVFAIMRMNASFRSYGRQMAYRRTWQIWYMGGSQCSGLWVANLTRVAGFHCWSSNALINTAVDLTNNCYAQPTMKSRSHLVYKIVLPGTKLTLWIDSMKRKMKILSLVQPARFCPQSQGGTGKGLHIFCTLYQ